MAVVVPGGGIKASERQDGTSLLRPKIAHGKAYGAYTLGLGSRALFERAKVEPFFIQAMNSLCDGALVPVRGGVLTRSKNGELLGAVGVTGDISDNDEVCAVAGIEAAGLVALVVSWPETGVYRGVSSCDFFMHSTITPPAACSPFQSDRLSTFM